MVNRWMVNGAAPELFPLIVMLNKQFITAAITLAEASSRREVNTPSH